MNSKKRLFFDSVIYGASRYISMITALFLTPIYTRILTKSEFGIQDSLNKMIDFAMIIVPLGYYAGLNRFFPKVKNNEADRKELIGTAQITLLISSIIAFILLTVFRWEVVETFIGKHTKKVYLAYLFFTLIVLFRPHSELTKTILRLKFKRFETVFSNIFSYLVMAGLGFYFVYFQHMGIGGIFLGGLIGTLVAVLLGFFFNRDDLVFRMSVKTAKEIIPFSLPLIASALLMQGSELLDRYLIKTYLPFTELGEYSIAVRIGSLSIFVISSFLTAWVPYAYTIQDKPYAAKTFRQVANLYVLVCTFLILGTVVLRKEILLLMAPKYFSVYHLIPIITFALIFKTANTIYTLGIQFSKNTKIIPICLFVSVVTNRFISAYLVQIIGLYGIVIGSFLSFLLYFILLYYFSNKYYKVNYDIKLPLTMLAALVGVTLGVNYLDQISGTLLYEVAAVKVTVLGIIGLVLFFYMRKNIHFKIEE